MKKKGHTANSAQELNIGTKQLHIDVFRAQKLKTKQKIILLCEFHFKKRIWWEAKVYQIASFSAAETIYMWQGVEA